MKCLRPFFIGCVAFSAKFAQADTSPTNATILWSTPLPASATGSSPTLATDGTIYQGTFDGSFCAFTSAGDLKWCYHAGREIKSTPAVAADGTIYFGCRDGKLYALRADGTLKWTFTTGRWIDSSPAISAQGTIYFGGWDGSFYALNPDGSLKWKYTLGAIIDSSPAVAADGTIYFGAHDKKFYALTDTGSIAWNFPTKGAITDSPAIGSDGDVLFNSNDGNIYHLNAAGHELWHAKTLGMTEASPVVDEAGYIYTAARYYAIRQYTTNGTATWITGSPVLVNETPVLVTGATYVTVPWRTLQAIATPDKRLWVASLDANLTASPNVGPDGTVYAAAEKFLYAIRPPGTPPLVQKSSWPMFHANAQHTGRVQ